MRIVLDMQGAQTASRYRGIGRYTMALAQAMLRHQGEHEIYIALNAAFPDTLEPMRRAFAPLLPAHTLLRQLARRGRGGRVCVPLRMCVCACVRV